ncbi:dihydrofolate reductase family protein [Propionicicella superfundia]|uniref:dihydrofolate reductase family protein n=1 Tax=Propionicicella superfundia TaxID=348582 RepID=UPI0004183827|nr:dihydrofolate reductase family protein [Propionicicella superfundia]
MKLVVHELLTLDGVMQGPWSPEEDSSGDFAHGGWMAPFAELPGWRRVVGEWFARTSAVLMGRTTYGLMHPYWSRLADTEDTVAAVLNSAPKYVVSSTLTCLDWANAQALRGGWSDQIALLKRVGDGELQVHGSWQLASALHATGLVDEYRLIVFPVAVGTGKRLFADGTPPNGFEVLRAEVLDGTVGYLVLRPAPFAKSGLALDQVTGVARPA